MRAPMPSKAWPATREADNKVRAKRLSERHPATADQWIAIGDAIEALKLARDKARYADCPQLLKAIRKALKSADGARRHVDRRLGSGREFLESQR